VGSKTENEKTVIAQAFSGTARRSSTHH